TGQGHHHRHRAAARNPQRFHGGRVSAAANSKAAHVLVVEDEAFLREVVAESLQEAGYEVAHVGNGDAGLAVLQSDAPVDVLVSDIRLPGLSGYELAAAGKARSEERRVGKECRSRW